MKIEDICARIEEIKLLHRPIFIAIDGFSGSGKTTLATQLGAALQNAVIIHMDDFIVKAKLDKRSSEQPAFDRIRLEQQVLIPLRIGRTATYEPLVWATGCLGESIEIPRAAYVIVEGISAFHPNIALYYDYKIWIGTSLEIANRRGHAREGSVENSAYWALWSENERAYQQTHGPELLADLVYVADDEPLPGLET